MLAFALYVYKANGFSETLGGKIRDTCLDKKGRCRENSHNLYFPKGKGGGWTLYL